MHTLFIGNMILDKNLMRAYKSLHKLSHKFINIETIFLEVDEDKVITVVCDKIKEIKSDMEEIESYINEKCQCCDH